MSGTVAVVTDSTACIPPDLAARWAIGVVQQQLLIDGQADDESRVPGDQMASAMRERVAVDTAAPEPGAFFWAYQEAIARGATAIVSLHISAKMSRTCEAAKQAAAEVNVPVHVLDTGTVGMSLGYATLAAARVAKAGGDLGQVVAMADVRISRSTELLHVQNLEYLRRGGRISGAAHLIGSTFAVKPLLTVRDGQIIPVDRTIGGDRALRKLVDRAVKVAGGRAVDVAVEHIGTDSRVEHVLDQLRDRLPNAKDAMRVEVSSIITAHVGPGAIGISISPAL